MPDLDESNALFAVFDGHGGREVALFCKRYMARELKALKEYSSGQYEDALRLVFHRMDEMIGDENFHRELNALKNDAPDDMLSELPETTRASSAESNGSVADAAAAAASKPNTAEKTAAAIDSLSSSTAAVAPDDPDVILLGDGSEQSNAAMSSGGTGDKGASDVASSKSPSEDDSAAKRSSESGGVALSGSTPEQPVPDSGESTARLPLQAALVLLQKLAETSMAKAPPGTSPSDDELGNAIGGEINEMASSAEQDRQAHICRLSEHRIAAGCTSVVALVAGERLYVANAGDSKAVLCRGGQAVAMSFEHKPQSDIETARIERAGGFVNRVGRVNNNLNLSRSIGDLKYKMNTSLPPKDQMITAEPDLMIQDLTSEDEFLFMACDGVWDVMSNQEAIDFVRERLAQGNVSLSKVCEEVFDHCISEDPRRTSGLGGDNMTCVIVQFKPVSAAAEQS
uniref:PPM-type phosphatase domain-containing protein n=1 Tax=Erythrolobus australicus TaxID=1077150 RepID=A0A7S1TLS0_9RHOD